MKKLFFLFAFALSALIGRAQSKGFFPYDSAYFEKRGGNAEMILENSTRDSLGFLYNKGGGRTIFKRALVKINDSTFIIGHDTLIVNPHSTYAALTDVVLTSLTAGQLPHWNAGTSKWNNFTPGAGDVNGWLGYTAGNIASRIDQNNAATTSAQLASILSDETGTGVAVFDTSPLFTTPRLASTSITGQYWKATDNVGNGAWATLSITTPGWDDVLGVGQSFTTDRTQNLNGHAFTFSGGTVKFAANGTVLTVLDGFVSTNTQAALSAGNSQYGPAYYSIGNAFRTVNIEGGIRWYNNSFFSGVTQINAIIFESNKNNGAYTSFGSFSDQLGGTFSTVKIVSTGDMVAGANLTATTNLTLVGAAGAAFKNIAGGMRLNVKSVSSGPYTVLVDDYVINTTAAITCNLPAVGGNSVYTFINSAAGTTTITPNGAQKIDDGTTAASTYTITQGQGITIIFQGTSGHEWLITDKH